MLLDYSNFKRLHEAASTSAIVNGREIKVGTDGTVVVKNARGEEKRVRLSTTGIKANIVSIEQRGDGYHVCSKSGRCETLSKDQANALIDFVDHGKPTEIDSGSMFKPNVDLKIEK